MVQAELFQLKNDVAERIVIGNGYALEWINEKSLRIYRAGILIKTTQIKAAIDKRRLAVELVIEAGVTKKRLAEALDVSRQSIDNWIDTFKKSGFEGLVNSYKGSKRSGRKQNASNLPIGNKARQLEQERKRRRAELQKQQLQIDFGLNQIEDESGPSELFEDSYEYEENRYAGSFIYWGIFQQFFEFMPLCGSYLGKSCIVVYLFCMMLIQEIGSVEKLKTVFKREFGRLIGVKQLFSKPVLWKQIHWACDLRQSKGLIEEFFKRQAIKGMVSLYWLYIDGHFIAYYGKADVRSGYFTQRDQMMPGQTELFVHDCQGKIVYFELQEGKGDIKDMMGRMSEKWSDYLGASYPLIIVDRECWGVEHFLSIEGYRFVTWEKFSKAEELATIAAEDFGDIFHVHGKPYQIFEDQKTYRDNKGNQIELRRIVIWNRKTNRRSACVTPLKELEDSISIAHAMLGRWGCSENSFKHMGDRWNMHYNPILDASEDSANQKISNPEYKRLKSRVGGLKKKLKRCELKLGRLPITTNKDGSLRKSSRRDRLQSERLQLLEQLADAEEMLKSCAEKVTLSEIDPEKKFRQLDCEGKNLWDLAQSLVWNSRKKLIEIFGNFLPNRRDLIPALEAITKSRGWVRSTKETIEIRLEPLDIPRFKAAQIQLCRDLNEKQIRLSNGKRLLYDVGDDPRKCPKN